MGLASAYTYIVVTIDCSTLSLKPALQDMNDVNNAIMKPVEYTIG